MGPLRFLAAASVLAALPALAGEPAANGEVSVDVELVLAVDVSWSMDRSDQEIQRAGYVAAFRSKEVQDAISSGGWSRVAVTYVEWAGAQAQSVVVPWTLLDSKDAAEGFAYRLATQEPDRQRRTSIAGAIDFAVPLFDGNGFKGLRRVIDVSGDGPNNQGRPVAQARDDAAARGITINGLPLMTRGEGEASLSWGSIPDLDRYYETCVIGGPGAFMIPVNDWAQFPQAVRRKLVLELAGGWPLRGPVPSSRPVLRAGAGNGADCLVGEAMWLRRGQRWNN